MKSHTHDQACECEHEGHFSELRAGGFHRPLPGYHPYGEAAGTVNVGTKLGAFHVCEECATTCLKGLIQ